MIADLATRRGPLGAIPRRYHAIMHSRMRIVIRTLGEQERALDDAVLYGELCNTIDGAATPAVCWLVTAVLGARLPVDAAVTRFRRAVELDGPDAAVQALLRDIYAKPKTPAAPEYWDDAVEVLADGVLVDVWLTSKADVATGIQRVVRETTKRWSAEHAIELLGWTDDQMALRRLTADERDRALHGGAPAEPDAADPAAGSSRIDSSRRPTVVVPWRAVLVEPELVGDPPRALRLMALAQHSNVDLSVIAYDSVPVSSSETANDGVSGSFAKYLSAVKHARRLAADSHSAATEFRGFRRMLAAQGLPGPDVRGLPLALEAPSPDAESDRDARALLGAYTLPLVLCVGSHEPRKNHLAVLQAAELAWRAGHSFTLAFVGGSGWHSERFDAMVAKLRADGRPITTIRALPDALLWAAYRVARCVLFPSLHEGFGLPVAEAIAARTPVITSNFGSMAEIAAAGGALLVDPRDDHALRDALVSLLTDDALHALLREQAAAVAPRSWDDYAREAWDYLVTGSAPAE